MMRSLMQPSVPVVVAPGDPRADRCPADLGTPWPGRGEAPQGPTRGVDAFEVSLTRRASRVTDAASELAQ
jgi:hypothetical protein